MFARVRGAADLRGGVSHDVVLVRAGRCGRPAALAWRLLLVIGGRSGRGLAACERRCVRLDRESSGGAGSARGGTLSVSFDHMSTDVVSRSVAGSVWRAQSLKA